MKLCEMITSEFVQRHSQDGAWKEFIEAVDTYLHGGGQGASKQLSDIIDEPNIQSLVAAIQNDVRMEWGSDHKRLYRGIAVHTKNKGTDYHSRPYRLTKKETDRLALIREGEQFSFTTPFEYPFQHWSHSKKVAEHFAYHNRFEQYHDAIIISADIPVSMVVLDVTLVAISLSNMFSYVQKNESEIIVRHSKPITCTMEQNDYWISTHKMKTKGQLPKKYQ